MLGYYEAPPLPRLYYEVCQQSEDARDGEHSSSASRKLPVPVLENKELDKDKEPKIPPGPRRPKRMPARLMSPDPILPGLQIMITENLGARVLVYKS